MLQEEVTTHADKTQQEETLDFKPSGLPPLPDFQAMYDQIVYEEVEKSAQGPNPKTYEQVHAEIQAELEADIAREEAEAVSSEEHTTQQHAGPQLNYVPQAELDRELAKLQDLSEQAKAGDTQALDQLRQKLEDCPHIWRRLGDLQLLVEAKMASEVSPADLLFLEAYRKRAAEIRYQLLGGSHDLLSQMAVSRVVGCWLFSQFLELRVLQEKHPKDSVKQLAQAEQRLESAVRTLTLAKKLQKYLAS